MKTKKITSLVLAALMASGMVYSGSTPAMAEDYAVVYYNAAVTTGVPLALRYAPNWAYGDNVKAVVPVGTTVYITGSTVGEFTPVTVNGVSGYLSTAHLAGAEVAKVYVNTEIATYMDAESAKAGVDSLGYFEPGWYFLYKTADGMLNISNVEGQPGRWINPQVAIDPQDRKVYILDSITYMNADDAAAEKNYLPGYYAEGEYFVFKDLGNGIMNVSKVKGQPGRWINENSKKTPDGTLWTTLSREYYTYMNAEDAAAGKNALAGSYGPGKYFIYKNMGNGIMNVTKDPSEPGRWINLNEALAPLTTWELDAETLTYMTAEDAAAEVNALATTYAKGTYFVYREYNGMLNISSVAGQPGRWINPKGVKTPPVYAPFKLGFETFTYMNAEDAAAEVNALATTYLPGDYFIFKDMGNGIINISTVKGQPGRWININATEIPGVTDVYTLSASHYRYASAEDAAAGVNAMDTVYPADTYYIYKDAGNGVMNLTKVKGQPGSWINVNKPVVVAPAPVEKVYYVADGTPRYLEAADAVAGVNSVGTYSESVVYIYKWAGNAVNVTMTPGEAGSWIKASDLLVQP